MTKEEERYEMKDKFIIIRKKREYKQNLAWPAIRVTQATYDLLTNWASISGKSITELTAQVVEFAEAHAEVVDE